jgi:hypothetical protein
MSEPKTPPYNFKEDIKGWNEFLAKCEQRVRDDENELRKKLENEKKGLKCEFLRNPEICLKPKYLLLGMEPSIPQKGAKEVCFFPLFLHYCAWKYLCDEKFNYYITDLAKGAMKTKYARLSEKERYSKWLPLFEDELKLLKPKKIIVIGNVLYKMIQKSQSISKKLKEAKHLVHYADRYKKSINEGYKALKENRLYDKKNLKKELKIFVEKLKEHLNPNRCNITNDYYKKLINDSLGKTERKVFAIYKHNFEQWK